MVEVSVRCFTRLSNVRICVLKEISVLFKSIEKKYTYVQVDEKLVHGRGLDCSVMQIQKTEACSRWPGGGATTLGPNPNPNPNRRRNYTRARARINRHGLT